MGLSGARDMLQAVSAPGSEHSAAEVSIIWPEDGAVLGGNVHVFVPARDERRIARVDVLLDDTRLIGSLPGGVYSLTWNTRGIAWGEHTLTARAYDTSGRTSTSAPVTVTVGEPLAVTVSSFGVGSTSSGKLSLSAIVEHARGGAWVQFLTEERYLCDAHEPPYTCKVSTESLPDGPLEVRAEVYDDVGNHALSEWVRIPLDDARAASTVSLTLPARRVPVR
ncbi:Ig-like domain-containing protein [Cystobacter fuscus]|nr:Ig-like domain-containing protein [Cystobacter fuscus]